MTTEKEEVRTSLNNWLWASATFFVMGVGQIVYVNVTPPDLMKELGNF